MVVICTISLVTSVLHQEKTEEVSGVASEAEAAVITEAASEAEEISEDGDVEISADVEGK